jgi:short-subunit dehydrogenase
MQKMDFRGRWVLVTGASSGLGREFARHLARDRGANLVVVARRTDRLEELRREAEADFKVRVIALPADLSDLEHVERLIEQIKAGPQLYAAILNAGVTHFGAHNELEWGAFQRMLTINVTSVVRLATELVPYIEQGEPGGGLLFVSSMAGIFPVPYQTAYSGTKAFMVHYACGLCHELKGRNVSITTYAPGGIVTEMTDGERFVPLRRFLMPVDQAARLGLDALANREYLHVPGLSNRLGANLARFLPRRLVTGWVAGTYRRALEAAARG